MAGDLMRRERPDHTLRPTALVHEAYLRLVDASPASPWENRAHFFGIAARAMRQILVDHARERSALKRGGGLQRITLDEPLAAADALDLDILAVHDALDKLAVLDERMARGVELRVFAGLTMTEVAEVLGVSKRTADGDWSVARKWLAKELG